MKPVFVLAGQGIHCERESAAAYRAVGLDVEIVPLAHLFEARRSVRECALLHLPGGFSYGDQLGAGLVLANRLRHARLPEGSTLFEQIVRFVRDGGFVVGICNGFQVLVRTGLLPNLGGVHEVEAALLPNAQEVFEDRWVQLHARGKTLALGALSLPVRHGEGRLVFRSRAHAEAVQTAGLILMQYASCSRASAPAQECYPANPNGSWLDAAGLCDPSGRVIGLMPHPEAALWPELHPRWTRGAGSADGLRWFRALAAHMESRA